MVLLDLRTGSYVTFNPVAGAIWAAIEGGDSDAAIVHSLQTAFEVPAEQIRRDVSSTLRSFEDSGWIVPRASAGPSTAPRPRPIETPPVDGEPVTPPSPTVQVTGSLSWRALGFLALVAVDLGLLVFRFRRLYSLLERRRWAARRADPVTLATICWAVDRAAAGYFKRAWCLQRSVACVLLLRGRGFPARLVLGVRTFPFEAHAWAEVEGTVVNDRPENVERFQVLDRV